MWIRSYCKPPLGLQFSRYSSSALSSLNYSFFFRSTVASSSMSCVKDCYRFLLGAQSIHATQVAGGKSSATIRPFGLDGWTSSTEGLDRFCNRYQHLSMELIINLTRPALDHAAPGVTVYTMRLTGSMTSSRRLEGLVIDHILILFPSNSFLIL